MLNKEEIFWHIWAGVLVLLFLMSLADLIIKKKRIEVYPISVIMEGDSDDYHVNFKKGMNQAAVEFREGVSFATLYANRDQAQQMELIKREVRGGARAMILAPVKPEEAVGKLEDVNPGRPAILLDQSLDKDTALDTIGVGGREIGRLLGKATASQASEDAPVYLFCGGLDYGDSTWVYERVRTVLDEQGHHYRLTERKNQDIYRQAVQKTDAPGGGRITIIAPDMQSLDQVTRILEENTMYQGRVTGLYGVGGTTSPFRTLDRRIVTGPTAYNQFDEGYLSMKQVVEAIQGMRQKQNIVLKAIYVDKGKLRDKACERTLCPIEQGQL